MNEKVAIVTGTTMGIGLSIAKQLSEDGFKVAVTGLTQESANEIAQTIPNSKGYELHVENKQQVFDVVHQVVTDLGRLDVIVNNAGITKEVTVADMSEAEFNQLWNVNVKGVLFGMQAAAEQFKQQQSKGKIINAASIGAYSVAEKHAGYSATKFAVRSLTQGAAKEFGADNITVNAYCPGYVMTPMMENILNQYAKQNGTTVEEEIARGSQRIALQRPATPQDISNLVSFLASDKADYITGQAYIVDGGVIYK